jgi:hypothetical protein
VPLDQIGIPGTDLTIVAVAALVIERGTPTERTEFGPCGPGR